MSTDSSEYQHSDFRVFELSLTPYAEALNLQLELHSRVREGTLAGALILLQHYPVITFGAGAHAENLLASEDALQKRGIELVQTDRGGDVTYHGPGQLVGYPIVNLRRLKSDVHSFLRLIEQAVTSTLLAYGLDASTNGPAGVWVGDKKICSIGIAIRGGVTYHGFALNVCPDLSHFQLINPCGLLSDQITSLERLVTPVPKIDTVGKQIKEALLRRLQL